MLKSYELLVRVATIIYHQGKRKSQNMVQWPSEKNGEMVKNKSLRLFHYLRYFKDHFDKCYKAR